MGNPLDYLGVGDASTTVSGKVRLATVAETTSGLRSDISTTPLGVAAVAIAGAPDWSEATKGIGRLSSSSQATTGTNDVTAMTPLKVASVFAAPPAIGSVTPAAGTFTNLDADGTGAISLDADAASNFSVAGAGVDLSLESAAGRVIINAEEAAANAITLLTAAGGIDANAALQINIATSQNAADALVLTASAGGIDILASGAAAGEDIDIVATGSSVNITSTENVATAIVLSASAGGIDVTAAGAAGEDLDLVCTSGSVNISGGEDVADAVVISAGAGGIDILATGEAAQDIDIVNTGGSVNITATENAVNAIYVRANGGTSETVKIHSDQGTGVASLDLLSDVGGITITAGLASDDAINVVAGSGGLDVDVALQMSLVSSENAADAIVINASAGGIDITAAGAAAEDLDLVCTSGSVNISGGEDVADAVVISAGAGGIDILATGEAAQDIDIVNTGGSVNITATENAADAVKITATTGGIDILASGAAAGEDIDIIATGSSVNITSTEAIASAIVLNASDAASGMTLACGSGGMLLDSGGVLELNSSAGAISIGGDAVAQAINVGTGAAARTITVGNTTSTSGLVLQAGTGEITVTGTVKEINAEFLYASGTDIQVQQSPLCQSNLTTGAAPTGTGGDVNLMYMQDGCLMEQFIIGTQTIIAPRMTANGLNIALDNTNAEGAEYNFGARNISKHSYVIGTDAAFFAEAQFYVEDLSGCAPLVMGFRKVAANNAVIADYTDYAAIGLNSATSATNVIMLSELNGGGQSATDSTDAWGGDAAAQSVGIYVSAAGVVTFTVGGVAASAAPSFTFDNTDVVMFFIHFLNGSDVAGEVSLVDLKIGYQA